MGCTVADHGVVSSARRRRRSSCEGEPGGRREVAVVVNDEGFEFIEFLNERECRNARHGERRREGVGEAEVRARHRRRRRS